eukprot:scaffold35089_cov44-Phaeocystis_antarctica.AAC.2
MARARLLRWCLLGAHRHSRAPHGHGGLHARRHEGAGRRGSKDDEEDTVQHRSRVRIDGPRPRLSKRRLARVRAASPPGHAARGTRAARARTGHRLSLKTGFYCRNTNHTPRHATRLELGAVGASAKKRPGRRSIPGALAPRLGEAEGAVDRAGLLLRLLGERAEEVPLGQALCVVRLLLRRLGRLRRVQLGDLLPERCGGR